MNILTTQYTLSMRALEIYTAGCKAPHCKGCHNPESWKFNQGEKWNPSHLSILQRKQKDFPNLIDRIIIFGGEPLDNPVEEVIEFLTDLKTLNLPIWLFTRYNLEQIPKEIKSLCSYIKCGRYEEDKRVEYNIQYGINLATSNQKIYKMEDKIC